jgi:hypothetical protein
MAKFIFCSCAALALLGSLGAGSRVWAKPPDLPVELSVNLDDDGTVAESPKEERPKGGFILGLDFLTGKFSFRIALPWKSLTPKQQEARALFDIGEECRKKGDLDMARTCYEEAHLLAPQTDFGRLAIQRLAEMDN